MRYWNTFFSFERGYDLGMRAFKEAEADQEKAQVFTRSKHLWKPIEREVQAWVEANWERWEEEKLKWFDDAMRAKVPVEYIPGAGDARRRESVRRASIHAEAEGGLAVAVRASIRRISVGGADGVDIIRVGGGKAKVSSVVPKDEDGT